MRWQGGRRSGNVEDRRGMQMSMGRRPMTLGGGCLTLIIILIALWFGADLNTILQIIGGGGDGGPVVVQEEGPGQAPPANDEAADFVRAVVGYTEDTWSEIFQQQLGRRYQPPKVVLFSQGVRTGCGIADSRVGPFYCPADQTVYLDLSFFRELRDRFGAPGDFAQAYVIAHEVGHHVQNLIGTSENVHAQQQRVSKAEANELSVRLELQADFYAGVWANHTNKKHRILEEGDVEEAIKAAASIGDDRLQEQATGHVNPDSFTHGSSAQRVRWLKRGLQTGDIDQGDTFSTPNL